MADESKEERRKVGERLRFARIAAGFKTGKEFADKHAIPQPTYAMHELGGRGLSREVAIAYSAALGVSFEWLQTGEGRGPGAKPPVAEIEGLDLVPIIGEVQAGSWREAVELPPEEWRYVPAQADPRYPGVPRFALVLRGPSMDKLYPDGTVLICVKLIDLGRDPVPGEKVICQRRDLAGLMEATVKELVAEKDGSFWLWPRSNHPAHQQPIPLVKPSDGDDNDDVRLVALVVQSNKLE